MINKKIVVTLFLLLIVISAGCLSDSTQSSSDVSSSADGVDTNPAVVGDEDQSTNQISIDSNDPILAERIRRLKQTGILVSIDNAAEISLGNNFYITGLTISADGRLNGYFENRGSRPIRLRGDAFVFLTKDYLQLTSIEAGSMKTSDGNLYFQPGDKRFFKSSRDMPGLVEKTFYIQLRNIVPSDT